jgi:transcriptional regulator with GAF, ATPase, and Fis domain
VADPPEIELAATFAGIARALLAEPTLEATLSKVCATAVETIAGCESAGISLVEGRRISTHGATDATPGQVDAIQYETDEGPCLDAIRDHAAFGVDDLATDERWPHFSARAASTTGVRSMLSLRLFAAEETMGALNLYARRPAAFGRDAAAVGAVVAAHAAVAMSTSRRIEAFEGALVSRATIEQAKGIIMAGSGCTPDEAWELLRQHSQAVNEKLRDVAADIVRHQERRS